MTIQITGTDANESELRAAQVAAEAVFAAHGLPAAECYAQYQAQQNGEQHDEASARCWAKAMHEAFSACFDGWASWPNTAKMVLA